MSVTTTAHRRERDQSTPAGRWHDGTAAQWPGAWTQRMFLNPMKQRKGRIAASRPGASADSAFDIWLNRGLHKLYGDIASEPIPEALMRLVEEDRAKAAASAQAASLRGANDSDT